MSKRAVEALTERFSGQKPEGSEGGAAGAPGEQQGPEYNLDDPKDQHRIQNPDPAKLTLSYGEVTLHSPSIAMRQLIYGFVKNVYNEVQTRPGPTRWLDAALATKDKVAQARAFRRLGTLIGEEIIAEINRNAEYKDDLCFICGKLMGKAGTVSDEQAEKLGREIVSKAAPNDFGLLYAQVTILARVNETIETAAQAAQNPTNRRGRRRG